MYFTTGFQMRFGVLNSYGFAGCLGGVGLRGGADLGSFLLINSLFATSCVSEGSKAIPLSTYSRAFA